jgi:hypothetical protein
MSRMWDDDELQELTPEERDILQRLGTLPREAQPARDLWAGVAARLAASTPGRPLQATRRRPRPGRYLIQAAAALLLFAGGFLAGELRSARPAPQPRLAAQDSFTMAAEVQRTGTEYVTALASLRKLDDPASQAQGREAALSVLYGAAHELTRLSPDNAEARQLLEAVSTTRSTARKSGATRIVRF